MGQSQKYDIELVWPKIGDKVVFFDSKEWSKIGGDVGNNECFHTRGTVLRTYRFEASYSGGPLCVDICADILDERGKKHKGKFVHGLSKVSDDSTVLRSKRFVELSVYTRSLCY